MYTYGVRELMMTSFFICQNIDFEGATNSSSSSSSLNSQFSKELLPNSNYICYSSCQLLKACPASPDPSRRGRQRWPTRRKVSGTKSEHWAARSASRRVRYKQDTKSHASREETPTQYEFVGSRSNRLPYMAENRNPRKHYIGILVFIVNYFLFFFCLCLVQEVQTEGRIAIDSPGKPNAPEIPPEDYELRRFTHNCFVKFINQTF